MMPLHIVKMILFAAILSIDTLILIPFAFIFMFLSIFNHDYFWGKLWCGLIDWLDKNNSFPKY